MDAINGFFKENFFLSNFYIVDIEYEGILYSSTEHAYQAAKSNDVRVKMKIASLLYPGAAKKYGRLVTLRPDWKEVNIGIMKDLLRLKFAVPFLRDKLIATGDAYLEETNYWGDTFWGVCKGEGENVLGKLLMEVRAEIRKEIGLDE